MNSIWYHRNIHLIPSLPLCSIIWAPAPPLSLSFLKLFIYGCVRSSLMSAGFLCSYGEQGLFLSCGERASRYDGWLLLLWSTISGARRLSTQYRTAWMTLWHVGSSWARDRTRVPCIARQILHPWTTRDVPLLSHSLLFFFFSGHGRSINHENMGIDMQILTKFPGHFQEDGH